MSSDMNVMGYEAAKNATVRIMKSGTRAVLLKGPPGVGKTAMAPEIAKALGLGTVFQIKLSHHDVPDVAGVPVPDAASKRTFFFASGDMLPPADLTGGCLVVLDEIGDCNISQQNLACQMIFEGRIHNYIFPENTYFFLTSNRAADRSGANRIVTKLANRAASITLTPHADELFEYGAKHGWNPTVLAFVKLKGMEQINPSDKRGMEAPTYFNSFDPNDPAQLVDPQFASSRSYEFTSKYLNYVDANEPRLERGVMIGELASMLGTPVALALTAFRDIATTMPDPEKILRGEKVKAIEKMEIWWALTLTLVSRVKKDQVKHLHAFMDKAPEEFLALSVRMLFDTRMKDVAGPDFTAMASNPKIKSMFAG